MIDIDKEIEEIAHELNVVIPEELQAAMNSRDSEANSEISDILMRQEILSMRLKQLTDRKYNKKTINLSLIPKDVIDIGSLVTLSEISSGTIRYVKLICTEISDIEYEYEEVTINSPIGKLLRHKKIGQQIDLTINKKSLSYYIQDFKTIHEY